MRANDGDQTGIKSDRFRHSRFEQDVRSGERPGGVARPTPNTLGGPWGAAGGLHPQKSFRPGRVGGAILDTDAVHHGGKGPKGWRRADAEIHEDVCIVLEGSPYIDASDFTVDVRDGVVFLEGEIDTRENKRLTELLCERVSGVRDVQNFLTYPASAAGAQERPMTQEEMLDETLRESFPASDPPGHFSTSAEDKRTH